MASGIAPLDALLDGGIARGRVSEIIGRAGTGRTSLVAAFAAIATGRGETIAWIDAAGAFDPASIAAAGVDLARVLWAAVPREASRARPASSREGRVLKAAERVLEAGGFGLVVLDFGDIFRAIPDSTALRIARAAERSGAAVIAIAPRRICGTFAALSLTMNRAGASFSRIRPGARALFDGLRLEPVITRNKLGGSGAQTRIIAALDVSEGAGELPVVSAHSSPPESRAARTELPSPAGRCHWHAGGAVPQRAGEGADELPVASAHSSPSRAGRGQGLGRDDAAVTTSAQERPLPSVSPPPACQWHPRIGEGIRHSGHNENVNDSSASSASTSTIAAHSSPSRAGRGQGLGRIDAAVATNHLHQNLNRAPLHSASKGSSPDRVPVAPPLQGEGSEQGEGSDEAIAR